MTWNWVFIAAGISLFVSFNRGRNPIWGMATLCGMIGVVAALILWDITIWFKFVSVGAVIGQITDLMPGHNELEEKF